MHTNFLIQKWFVVTMKFEWDSRWTSKKLLLRKIHTETTQSNEPL